MLCVTFANYWVVGGWLGFVGFLYGCGWLLVLRFLVLGWFSCGLVNWSLILCLVVSVVGFACLLAIGLVGLITIGCVYVLYVFYY